MYHDSVTQAVQVGVRKAAFLKSKPLGYFVASMLAGIYVGLGIVLIFSIGGPLALQDHPMVRLVMGASFGLALLLVVFAGSELFTGNAMYLTFSWLASKVTARDLVRVWILSWLGNLVGSLALAWVTVASGSLDPAMPLVAKVVAAKMSLPIGQLIARGLLCNLLVCLALWMAGRTASDGAKVILIGWCLFGFIGSGFEHSIANMSLLALGVFGETGATWGGYAYNLLWVTIGNTLAGAAIMAGAYHFISGRPVVEAVRTSV